MELVVKRGSKEAEKLSTNKKRGKKRKDSDCLIFQNQKRKIKHSRAKKAHSKKPVTENQRPTLLEQVLIKALDAPNRWPQAFGHRATRPERGEPPCSDRWRGILPAPGNRVPWKTKAQGTAHHFRHHLPLTKAVRVGLSPR